jgi:hypothetical protein
MGRSSIVALAALGLMWLGSRADQAVAAPPDTSARTQAAQVSELSSQRRRLRREPVRITVYPGVYPRLIGPRRFGFDEYPRPYPYDWPGPFATRECIGWLAPQARPSGPVIVPQRRCWWVPG